MCRKRVPPGLLAVVILAAGTAPAAPVPKELREIPKLDDSSWTGTMSNRQGDAVTYTFEKDGVLAYAYSTGASYRNGTWKQDGKAIYMEFNNKYAEYTGEIKGDTMEGKAVNVKGLEWTWTVTRNKPEKAK